MSTPDYINHAARAMDPDAFADRDPQGPSAELQWAVRRKIATDHAEALDAAGLLVTPEHNAAVAAKALRVAADRLNHDRRIHDASCGESPAQTAEQAGRDHGVTIGLRQAVRHLDERAAAIEAGAS